jgi:hypothetical protein
MATISKEVVYRGHRITVFSIGTGNIEASIHKIRDEGEGKTRRTDRLHRVQGRLVNLPRGHIDPIAREALSLLTKCADYLDQRLQSEADAALERRTMSKGIDSGLQLFETSTRREKEENPFTPKVDESEEEEGE